MDPENLVLKCLTCDKEYPATSSMYASLIRQEEHQGHKVRFIDKTTGEVVAKSGQEALRKGLIERKVETGEDGLDFTIEGDALIPMRISLPGSALTLYFYAKKNGISDHANVIDFLWEYAQKGFMEAHNLGLTLAPVKVAPKSDDSAELKEAIKALGEMVEKLIPGQAPDTSILPEEGAPPPDKVSKVKTVKKEA